MNHKNIILNVFFGLILVSVAHASDNNKSISVWTKMAQSDLQITRDTITENTPQAQEVNSFYEKWLNNGFNQAWEKAKTIDSYPGYISVMQYYLSGFYDFHTNVIPLLKIINPSEKWPGFIVGVRNDKIVVTYSDNIGKKSNLPPIDAQLLGCDGKSVQQLIVSNILPFNLANARYPSTWQAHTPQLFIWQQNPFIQQQQICTFLVNKREQAYLLQWQVIVDPSPLSLGVENFQQKLAESTFGQTPLFGITNFGVGAVWISIPIFAGGVITQGTTTTKLLTHIAAQMKKYKTRNLIVFDLRGNTGGDPQYARQVIVSLYGENFLRYLSDHFPWNSPEKIKFVATETNLQYMIQSNSPAMMVAGMRAAIATGKKTFIYCQQILEPGAISKTNPVKAKVVLLTDGRCASECANFVMTMKSIPGVIHVGQPTAALTSSTWNAVKVFPDNVAAIIYPIGEILSPKINNGVPLFPEYYYRGYIGDTNALKKLIWHLYGLRKE